MNMWRYVVSAANDNGSGIVLGGTTKETAEDATMNFKNVRIGGGDLATSKATAVGAGLPTQLRGRRTSLMWYWAGSFKRRTRRGRSTSNLPGRRRQPAGYCLGDDSSWNFRFPSGNCRAKRLQTKNYEWL